MGNTVKTILPFFVIFKTFNDNVEIKMYMYSVLFRFFSPAFLTWKEGRKGQGAGQSLSVLVSSAAFISIPEGAKLHAHRHDKRNV